MNGSISLLANPSKIGTIAYIASDISMPFVSCVFCMACEAPALIVYFLYLLSIF